MWQLCYNYEIRVNCCEWQEIPCEPGITPTPTSTTTKATIPSTTTTRTSTEITTPPVHVHSTTSEYTLFLPTLVTFKIYRYSTEKYSVILLCLWRNTDLLATKSRSQSQKTLICMEILLRKVGTFCWRKYSQKDLLCEKRQPCFELLLLEAFSGRGFLLQAEKGMVFLIL